MNHPLDGARWIAPSERAAAPIIRRLFHLEKDGPVRLTVTGLGFFEASVNGQRVDDAYFQPVFSDYEPRALKDTFYPSDQGMSHRIYYRVFDVTSLAHAGENELTLHLGGGWFVQEERVCEGHMSFGDRPKCIFALEAEGARILSDGTETWQDSDIVASNLYLGERHDPAAPKRQGQVILLPDPDTTLCEQTCPPDRCVRRIAPKLLGRVNGRDVYDVGENITGVVAIRSVPGYVGVVALRFAEEVNEDGSLNFDSSGALNYCASGVWQIMQDTFVCDGKARTFAPKFTWHGFRYFDVQGEIDGAEVWVIHADTPVTAEFDSDSEGLNHLFDAYLRGQLGNMHAGIPSDCPHRERLGYTGDGQVCAPTGMLLLDSREFYRKWIYDILDCQDAATGHVQHTAPFMGGGGGPGGWGCAIVIVPYHFWRQWGETAILKDAWNPMLRWIDFLLAHRTDGLVTSEIEGGWCLGDWCIPEEYRLPLPFVNTYYLIRSLRMMREMAPAVGHPEEIPALAALEQETLAALQRAYQPVYEAGIQGADAYASALGLQDAAVCAARYAKLGRFDTGFLGTDVLCDVLFGNGYADVAHRLLSSEERGSFLYQKRRGATTIWEHWDGCWPEDGRHSSHNHPMFGAAARQIFHGVLGIRQRDGSCGWAEAVIAPHLPADMQWAMGSILTPRGRIEVSLQRTDAGVLTTITVPRDIRAFFQNQLLPPGTSTVQ